MTNPAVGVSQSNAQLQGIQLVRALAVCLVLYAHVSWVLPSDGSAPSSLLARTLSFGYAGVDIFFVVSGFIICFITDGRPFSLRDYAVRRFLRIFPFYLAFSVAWLSILVAFRNSPAFDWTSLVTSLLVLPMREPPLLGVGWSLEHEVLFYTLAGGLIALGRQQLLLPILLLLFAIGCVLHGLSPSLAGQDIWDLHIFSPLQIQFAFGVFAYKIRHHLKARDWRQFGLLGVVIFLVTSLILAIYQGIPGNLHQNIYPAGVFGIFRVVGYGLAGFCILACALAADGHLSKIEKTKAVMAMVLVGDASYAIYLSHPIVFQALNTVVGHLFSEAADPVVLFVRLIAAVIAVVVGILWFRRIEAPVLKMLNRLRSGRNAEKPLPPQTTS